MQIRISKRLFIIILCIMVGCVGVLFSKLKPRKVNSVEELYAILTDMCLNYKSGGEFELNFDPEEFDYDELLERVAEKNEYQSYNLGDVSYKWRYKGDKAIFSIKLGYLSNKYQLKWADVRAKELAKKVEGKSDYEKIKIIHDYIILYSDYGKAGIAFSNIMQGPYWALYPGRVVCNGYALTFYKVMKYCNIPVTYEVGGGHAWNAVYVDGYWYNIDLTWDDLGGKKIRYDYFLTDDTCFYDHAYGSSNAPEPHEVTGRSAMENYKMFPNYKLLFYILVFLKLISPFALFYIVKRIIITAKARKKKQQELLIKENELLMRQQEDLERDFLLFNNENSYEDSNTNYYNYSNYPLNNNVNADDINNNKW